MFYLLRLIRKDLIRMNNVKKYVLYALGEIVLIVVGILIAVQIGNWNERRLERIEERIILERIREEVGDHSGQLSSHLKSLGYIKTALQAVEAAFDGDLITNHVDFLNSVIKSAGYSYSLPRFEVDTFEEIIGTGKLALIQRIELRNFIKRYYRSYDNILVQVEAVRVDYGLITLKLIPRSRGLNSPLDDLSEEAGSELVNSVLNSELDSHIVQQRNRLNFLAFRWTVLGEQANKLLTEIETELEAK